MRKLLLILILAFSALGVFAQSKEVPGEIKDKLLSQMKNSGSTLGTEFVIGITPNDFEAKPFQVAAVYVAAPEETRVTIETSSGIFAQGVVPKNDVLLFSSPPAPGQQPFSAGFENWEQERVVQNKAVIIRSDKPVSVYVLNSKNVSSEGYLAIPVASWGKRYIHCSYWDFREGREWGAGFQVMASEDDTRVTIKLKGQGQGSGVTFGGRTIGETVRITLNRGDMYQIQGDGTTRGIFDLSGSEITANKPIGVISFHNRTMIPKFVVTSGRDHLVAMMPPVQAWGREYASIEMQRGTGKGDYFRVVSSEDDNEVVFSWFDMDTGELTQSVDVTLQSNDVWSPFDVDADGNTTPDVYGVNGTMHIKSEKPIFIMQYSYSANWDFAGGNYDPFMFPVTAVEQFTYATLFQTPKNYSGDNEYNDNYFNLLYVGDTTNPGKNLELAKSIIIDDVPLDAWDSKAPIQRIPGTRVFYAKIRGLEQGVHRIYGDAPFGGYIYGFASFDSYGWPAATNYLNLSERDPWAPVVEWEQECDVFYFDVTDMKPDLLVEDTTYVDVGLNRRAEVIENVNFKVAEEDVIPVDKDTREETEFFNGVAVEEYSWRYQVDDPYQDASLTLKWYDAYIYPNDTTVSIKYIADKITFTDEEDLAFGEVRVNTGLTKTFEITIDNENLEDFSGIEEGGIYLAKGTEFTLNVLPQVDNVIPIEITYTPTIEYPDLPEDPRYESDPFPFDYDSLIINTNCLTWEYELVGQGVLPQLTVKDFNAGVVNPGVVVDYRQDNGTYIMRNAGTMLTDVTGVVEIFRVDADKNRIGTSLIDGLPPVTSWTDLKTHVPEYTVTPADDAINFQIDSRDMVTNEAGQFPVGTLSFMSTNTGEYNYEIVFEHNADEKNLKESAYWTATVTDSKLEVTDLEWPEVRVLSYNTENSFDREELDENGDPVNVPTFGFIKVSNTGDADLQVFGFKLINDAEGHFQFDLNYGPNGTDDDSENRWLPTRNGTKPGATDVTWNNFQEMFRLEGEPDFAPSGPSYLVEGDELSTIMVPMIFNPQNTAAAVQNSELTAQVEVWGRASTTPGDPIELLGVANLSGTAFLPTITVTGYVFPGKTLEGEYSTHEEGKITIETDYIHAPLTLFDIDDGTGTIFFGVDEADFGLADFGDIANPTDNTYDIPVTDFVPGTGIQLDLTDADPSNDRLEIPVYFRPEAKGKIARIASFTILSDATPSTDDPNNRASYNIDNEPQTANTQLVEANAFTVGTRGDITFGNQIGDRTSETTKCDPVPGLIVLDNTDATSSIYVDGDTRPVIEVTLPAPFNAADYNWDNVFQVGDYPSGPGEIEIVSGNPEQIPVNFVPDELPDDLRGVDITVNVIVGYESEGSGGTRVPGQFDITPWTISFTMTDVVLDINDVADRFEPSQTPPLDIRATSPDWAGAAITSIGFELYYNMNMFYFQKDLAFDNAYLPNGWEYVNVADPQPTADENINRIQVEIRSTDNTPWPGDANVFNPRFMILIHENWGKVDENGNVMEYADGNDLYVDQSSVNFNDRGRCIFEITEPGYIETFYCSPQNHNVRQSEIAGASSAINPNPVSGNSFDLDYSIPVGGHVQVTLIDATGKIVAVPISEMQDSGEYSISINTESLGTGVYQLVLKSANFNSTQPVNIVK